MGRLSPSDYGIPCKRLPTTDTLWWMHLPMAVPAEIDGPVLISDGDLEGIEFGAGALNPYDAFRGMRPTAVLDYGRVCVRRALRGAAGVGAGACAECGESAGG